MPLVEMLALVLLLVVVMQLHFGKCAIIATQDPVRDQMEDGIDVDGGVYAATAEDEDSSCNH